MWKTCPYCREYSFDEHALFDLSYSTVKTCKSCGKLVRNDPLRQLLVIPAILAGALIGALVLYVAPPWLTPVAWVLMATLVIIPLMLVPKPVKADQPEFNLTPFEPDPNNDKVIIVDGWNEDELRTILDGYIAEGPPGAPSYGIVLHQEQEDRYWLTFPQDIHPFVFASLVNYLLYPIEFGIGDRIITVVGKTTLNSAFEGISEPLCGQKAVLYVPENDQDYDVVYLQTASGANLAYSFAEAEGWKPVKIARLSLDVQSLAETIQPHLNADGAQDEP
jgi:uncharacterized protein (DUF983 family)